MQEVQPVVLALDRDLGWVQMQLRVPVLEVLVGSFSIMVVGGIVIVVMAEVLHGNMLLKANSAHISFKLRRSDKS